MCRGGLGAGGEDQKQEGSLGKSGSRKGSVCEGEMAHFSPAETAVEEPGSWPSSSPTRPPSIRKWWFIEEWPLMKPLSSTHAKGR